MVKLEEQGMVTPEHVVAYWINEVGPSGWYQGSAALDADITRKFGQAWQDAKDGACGLWLTSAAGALGYLVLTDQFPRNMFRGQALSFATDKCARAAAKMAIDRDWDMRIAAPERQFFYMPLMHSENLIDQDRAVRLMATRMPDGGADNLVHARAHRAVIRQFGRFPYRNDALGRKTTKAEAAWMKDGGYRLALRSVDQKAEAV